MKEKDEGQDEEQMKKKEVREGDLYIIKGKKSLIKNEKIEDILKVMERKEEDVKGEEGIREFIIERKRKGIQIGKNEKKMGKKGEIKRDVILENVRVKERKLIGGVEGKGLKKEMKMMEKGRMNIEEIRKGEEESMIEDKMEYEMDRKKLGKKIEDLKIIKEMIEERKEEIYEEK